MNASGCWKCGEEPHDSLFCKFCNTLQPPATDYYRFFNLEHKLNINLQALQERYYSLSRLVHPDRFQSGTPKERRFSLDATAILNDAFRTLRDPVARAEYFLKEAGLEAADRKGKRVPPELLEEVFEVNSALEELHGGDTSVRKDLEDALGRFKERCSRIDAELGVLFVEYDRARERETLTKIRGLLDRRSFISNLVGEVEEGLEAH